MKPRGPSVPLPLALSQAIDQSTPLESLARRLEHSRQRLEQVRGALPGPLAQALRPGPLDETRWTILAPNAAVAAKLRQLLPTLQQRLRDAGWPDLPIVVHIRT